MELARLTGCDIRKKNVRKKLNAMALEFDQKNVLIVDGAKAAKTFAYVGV